MKNHKTHRFSAEAEFSIDAASLWVFLGNTNALNRLMRLPAVGFSPVGGDPLLFRNAEAAMLPGWKWRWREFPFDWAAERFYTVRRIFENGPVRTLRWGIELFPAASGTRVRVFAEITPRNLLALPLVALLGRKNVQQVLKLCREMVPIAKAVERAPDTLPSKRVPKIKKEKRQALSQLGARLKSLPGVSPVAVVRLLDQLVYASDEEVLRMRPFELADHWREPRDQVLCLFLHAASEGLLQLDWVLMCPNCRVPKARFDSLKSLTPSFHCDLCGVSFETNMDRYTELRFSVSPRLRQAADLVYCIGGPVSGSHLLVQQSLGEGETVQVSWPKTDTTLRVRALRSNVIWDIPGALTAATSVTRLVFDGERWFTEKETKMASPSEGTRPNDARLELVNRSRAPMVAVVEKTQWSETATTAAQVSHLPEFRKLFGAEVLGRDVQVGVRHLALLFTDLKRSTRLYESIGDAPAYSRVRRHFEFLTQRIERNEGVVVKTMGDAVMASFLSAEQLARAASEILLDFETFATSLGTETDIEIKLGAHLGPAICVTANGQLDYFGRTVNLAARIQEESAGNDFVMSEILFSDPEVRRVLEAAGLSAESWQTSLKGLFGEFTLFRLRPRNVALSMPGVRRASVRSR